MLTTSLATYIERSADILDFGRPGQRTLYRFPAYGLRRSRRSARDVNEADHAKRVPPSVSNSGGERGARSPGAPPGAQPINPRLVNLLGSFIGGTSAYALARLEFCLTFPDAAAPPVLQRLPDASERTLRERWDAVENQLHDIVDYVKRIEDDARSSQRSAAVFRILKRTVRELDQYARAMRWVMTVTEHKPTE